MNFPSPARRPARPVVAAACLAALAWGGARAQDSAAGVPRSLLLENRLVRVFRSRIAPGGEFPARSRARTLDIALSPMHVVSTARDGSERTIRQPAGAALWLDSLTRSLKNAGKVPLELVEVEINDSSRGRPLNLARDPLVVDAEHSISEFSNDDVRVFRFRLGPYEESPLHDHPQCLSVHLTDLHVRVADAAGTSVVRRTKAGQVLWNAPLTHEVVNVSENPLEVIFIEFKAPPPGAPPPPRR